MKSNIHVEGQVDTGVQTLITNQNPEPPKAVPVNTSATVTSLRLLRPRFSGLGGRGLSVLGLFLGRSHLTHKS